MYICDICDRILAIVKKMTYRDACIPKDLVSLSSHPVKIKQSSVIDCLSKRLERKV